MLGLKLSKNRKRCTQYVSLTLKQQFLSAHVLTLKYMNPHELVLNAQQKKINSLGYSMDILDTTFSYYVNYFSMSWHIPRYHLLSRKLLKQQYCIYGALTSDGEFLHVTPRIPGGDKSIFTVVIHYWRSTLRQFARARTIDEYDVTMPVPHVRVTSQINSGDVTMLSQKRPPFVIMAISTIDNCFSGFLCSRHKIACKK